jgi:hypothetical protein
MRNVAMNMADSPQHAFVDRLALEAAVVALDSAANALGGALLALAKTRKDIHDILYRVPEGSGDDEKRWSCD